MKLKQSPKERLLDGLAFVIAEGSIRVLGTAGLGFLAWVVLSAVQDYLLFMDASKRESAQQVLLLTSLIILALFFWGALEWSIARLKKRDALITAQNEEQTKQ